MKPNDFPDIMSELRGLQRTVGGVDAKIDLVLEIIHGNDNEAGLVKRLDRAESRAASEERKYFKLGALVGGVVAGAMGVIGFFVAKAQAIAAIIKAG